jgi:outer membrane immunogenic protein
MKRLLAVVGLGTVIVAGAANAADLATKAPLYKAPPAPPAYSWTGCYLGVEGGGNWGKSQHFQNQPGTAGFGLAQTAGIDLSGGLFGGTVGCNYQFGGGWVVGLEDDMSWTNKKGSAGLIPPFNTTENFQTSETWLDTLRGRLGFAWDRWFFYGTGGAAFANMGIQLCDPVGGCGSQSKNVTGWTAGGGGEYAFYGAWSLKIEYLHVDFGTQGFSRTPLPAPAANGASFVAARNVTLTDDIVRAGLNYRF